jgi:hypothetical protein
VHRLPPALAAAATSRVLELLGDPPGHVLELDQAGIHAVPLRIAGFEVTVVERDAAARTSALARAGGPVHREIPPESFDAVVAPEGTDLAGIDAGRRLIVRADGSVVG